MTARPTDRSNIASAINAAHAGVEAAKREGARYAVECGRLLAQAKETVPHGGWDAWLRQNTALSPRTAQLYMRIARHVEGDPIKAQRVAGLSVREAAAETAKPRRLTVARRPLSPEGEEWLAGFEALWAEALPECKELFAREIHARGDVTVEERDRIIRGAYLGLSSDELEAAGDRLARSLLRGQSASATKVMAGVLRQHRGEPAGIALGDALWRSTL
ncbi:DUF3102 domain-containing protein [Methylorubrum thiocyanatum]|uniref:DUF3102 domain-containing protein n=1 Tax=Methylorubrum thiocyanatum TaxID=47958 RepID=UPI003F7E9B34